MNSFIWKFYERRKPARLMKKKDIAVIPLHCGELQMDRRCFGGGSGDAILELPVFAFLIIHPQGRILFDTGLPGELWTGRSSLELTPGLTARRGCSSGLVKEIEGRGYALGTIPLIVNSHTHLDHAGGNSLVRGARCYERIGLGYQRNYDLFGDGSIYILATPGHANDHQSLLVRGQNRQVLLTGDACFRPANLTDLKLPLLVADQGQALRSLKKLRDISRAAATVVLTSHDPAATGEQVVI
jgi:N-acyl homoserine lactone hydrolase